MQTELFKGVLIWVSVFSGLLLIASITEWVGQLSSISRTVVVVLFSIASLVTLIRFVLQPLVQLARINTVFTDDEAAKKIGSFFPVIGDKLLNFLELKRKAPENALVQASLQQRSQTFEHISFTEAVDTSEAHTPVRFFIPIVIVFALLLLIAPKDFISSTRRVIHFRQEFIPAAPFSFTVSSPLEAYQNEDYQLLVELKGESVPSELYYVDGNMRLKMIPDSKGSFTLMFPKIQQSKVFHLETAGYSSSGYSLKLLQRPSLNMLSAQITYPGYLGKKPEYIEPAGELTVPEGSNVEWKLKTLYTENASFYYDTDSSAAVKNNKNSFSASHIINASGLYGFKLYSGSAIQKGKTEYNITSLKDEFPKIQVHSFIDTLLFRFITIGGEVSDDHGISQLNLIFQKGEENKSHRIKLNVQPGATQQQLFFQWLLDSLQLQPGDQLSYYLQVFDNDGVNGRKSAKSQTMYLKIPTKMELEEKVHKASSSEKKDISKSHKEAKELRKHLDETIENLKGKKELSWEDKQNIKQLLKDKDKLSKQIEEFKKENELLNMQRNELQRPSPELEEKAEQLQELMNNLLDEETRKLYDELQKLLQEQADADQVQSLLQNLKNKEINLEEELERTLELFKRLQVEQNLEKLTEDLNELAKAQDSLAQETLDRDNSVEDLKNSQEEIENRFQSIKEELEQTKEKNNELKQPQNFEDTSGEEDSIDKEINDSKSNLEKNNRKNSSQNQENSGKNMKQLAQKLENMQGAMQMQQMQEDISNLRGILSNLITLSYDQERVMKEFRAVNQSNPQFVTLSEEQLKIQDDSKIIKDSLLALANRVMALSSFVTRELNEMDTQLEKSSAAIRDREQAKAVGYQQLSMTSMNNLALMLDNVLQQMQQSMASAMGKSKGSEQQPMPGMSELQKQLNDEIRELRQSGKTGKELSEELAKLAAKQEMIRKALREAEEKLGGKDGKNPGNLGNLQRQMEQSELDLVNKNLSKQLQNRQQQILTRLLEAEESLREQEMDSKRESKTAVQYEQELPRAFEEYMKQKQKEIELIKTIPPKLHPYYKKEVNDYFDRLKNEYN